MIWNCDSGVAVQVVDNVFFVVPPMLFLPSLIGCNLSWKDFVVFVMKETKNRGRTRMRKEEQRVRGLSRI